MGRRCFCRHSCVCLSPAPVAYNAVCVVQAPVSIDTNRALDITATRVSDTVMLVCFRTSVSNTAVCRAAAVSPGGTVYDSAVAVPDSADYSTGMLANLQDTDGRAVLAFSCGGTSPASKLLVLGLAGTTVTPLATGTLDRFEVSATVDRIALVSLSRLVLLLAYRVRPARASSAAVIALSFDGVLPLPLERDSLPFRMQCRRVPHMRVHARAEHP